MIAIIIPYYKLEYFDKTLESLSMQSDKRFNVYIGDDASPQNPTNLLNTYIGKINFAYHRFSTNLGSISLVQHWERCIAKTQNEEWLMILGDDDVISENFIKCFYENIHEIDNVNVVRFASVLIDGNDAVLSEKYVHPLIEKSTDFLIRKITGQTRSSLSEYVIRKKNLVEKKFIEFPLAWHSDDYALLRFSNFSDIFSINTALVKIRISDLSISGNKTNQNLKNKASLEFYYLILKKHTNHFSKNQINIILNRLERFFFKQMSFNKMFFLFRFHFQNQGFFSTLKFLRRILINYKL